MLMLSDFCRGVLKIATFSDGRRYDPIRSISNRTRPLAKTLQCTIFL